MNVSNELQEKLLAKITEQLPGLITKEDIKSLTVEALERALFKDRVVKQDWGREERRPPLIVEMLEQLLREQVQAAVRAWLTEHAPEMGQRIEAALAKGGCRLVQEYLDERVMSLLPFIKESLKQG